MDTRILIAAAAGALLLANFAGKKISSGLDPLGNKPSGDPANPEPTINPAIGMDPPWTDNPTPGEIELQAELAEATAAGENLTPILQNAYGPAWDLMVITPAEWQQKLNEGWTEAQLKQYYTLSEAERTEAILGYWVSQHPGEPIPEIFQSVTTIIEEKPSPENPYGDSTSALEAAAAAAALITQQGQNPYANIPVPDTTPVEGVPSSDGNTYDVNPYSPTYGQVITPAPVTTPVYNPPAPVEVPPPVDPWGGWYVPPQGYDVGGDGSIYVPAPTPEQADQILADLGLI